MGTYTMLLPDVGEGVAEAEIVEWNVKVGDTILEDEVVGAVMTDKAAVEIPSSVTGKVTWLAGDVGDVIAVGADLVRLEVDGDGNQKDDVARDTQQAPVEQKAALAAREVSANITDAGVTQPTPPAAKVNASGAKPLAAPSVRKRVKDAGADLSAIPGTGPAGRITHDDVDLWLEQSASTQRTGKAQNTMIKEIKVIGMRRKIAEQMSLAKSRIPHITIVEEVDVTNLEELRAELNTTYADTRAKLTVLPFVMKAIVEAAREIPEINSIYDDEKNIVYQHGGVHIGIATQTGQCREGSVVRDDLSGSTITVTSLGPLGALATTPIINHPEVAIIGINKMAVRPMWDGQQFMPRTMMNISASFDHRIVDGWQAALTVQKLKTLLEKPAMLFVED